MENNKMISFGEIIENCFNNYEVYVPLIQRNYKWEAKTAAKLATDLWNAYKNNQSTYTIGMITFYSEETDSETRLQLIDGQQRIITLFLILRFLEPQEDFFLINFERDEGISSDENKRISYLKDITNHLMWKEENLYTDVYRFKENYCAIQDSLGKNAYEESKKEEFIEYIKNRLYFLLHISETKPFDEFMNLNNNKTRFVISDRIKANLIIGSKDNKQKKENVLKLFQELSKQLFSETEIWKLISWGYCEKEIPEDNSKRRKDKLYPDENRLKLLCCERYGSDEFDVSGTLGYEFAREFKILNQYNIMLKTLSEDIANNNWNSYNAFKCLCKLKSETRFFKLVKNIEENSNRQVLEEHLLTTVDELTYFEKACFIESQLANGKLKLSYIDENKIIESEFNKENKSEWYSNGSGEYETFKEIYYEYINQKYQRAGE